jgi:hypothetical protein
MSFPGTVTKLVGTMPFAGKRHIAALHHAGLRAAHRRDRHTAQQLKEVLSYETVAHTCMAFIGGIALGINAYNSFRYGGALYPAETIYDGVYMMANVGSAYVQGRMATALGSAIDRHAPEQGMATADAGAEVVADYNIRPTLPQRAVHVLGHTAYAATLLHGGLSMAGTAVIS